MALGGILAVRIPPNRHWEDALCRLCTLSRDLLIHVRMILNLGGLRRAAYFSDTLGLQAKNVARVSMNPM